MVYFSLELNSTSLNALYPVGSSLTYCLLTAAICIFYYMYPATTFRRAFLSKNDWGINSSFVGWDLAFFGTICTWLGIIPFFITPVVIYSNNQINNGTSLFANVQDVWYFTSALIALVGLLIHTGFGRFMDWSYGQLNPDTKPMMIPTRSGRAWKRWGLMTTYWILIGFILFSSGLGYYQAGHNMSNNVYSWFTAPIYGAASGNAYGAWPVLFLVTGILLAFSLFLSLRQVPKFLIRGYFLNKIYKIGEDNEADQTAWDERGESLVHVENNLFLGCEGPGDLDKLAFVKGWIPVVYLPFNWFVAYQFFLFVACMYNTADEMKAFLFWAATGGVPAFLSIHGQSLDFFVAYHLVAMVVYISLIYITAVMLNTEMVCPDRLNPYCTGQQLNYAWPDSAPANQSDTSSLLSPFTANFFSGMAFATAVAATINIWLMEPWVGVKSTIRTTTVFPGGVRTEVDVGKVKTVQGGAAAAPWLGEFLVSLVPSAFMFSSA